MLRVLSLLPLALSPAPPAPPVARALTCAEAEEVYEEDLGDLSGRPVQIRICTAPVGERQRVHVQTRWIPAGEDDAVIQHLLDDLGPAVAGAFLPSLEGDVLRLSWPSTEALEPLGQTTTAVWRWDERTRRFGAPTLSRTSPWAEGLARVQIALEDGDFAAARSAVSALGTTPNGGKTWEEDTLFLDFLAAANRVARGKARLFDNKGAAAVVADVLLNPPVVAHEQRPSTEGLVLCRGLALRCEQPGSFNDLPATVEVANQLSAAAFYLARGKQPGEAVQLLQTVLGRFGASPDLQLLYADALWAAERREEAAAAYRTYAKMEGAETVRRVRKRSGASH